MQNAYNYQTYIGLKKQMRDSIAIYNVVVICVLQSNFIEYQLHYKSSQGYYNTRHMVHILRGINNSVNIS